MHPVGPQRRHLRAATRFYQMEAASGVDTQSRWDQKCRSQAAQQWM